jgi:beta-glucosidase
MTIGERIVLAALCLSGAVSCGGGGGEGQQQVTPECDKPANVARRQALLASQPTFGVRSKAVIPAEVTFASEAGDPGVLCSVTLQFKDLNGSGAVEAYEDWRSTAQDRAADLVGRMTAAEKLALMAHATTTDVPTAASAAPSASLEAAIAAGIRFGSTSASAAQLVPRATWANNVQALCEASPLGIPFVLSMAPSHSSGNGRIKATGFSQWPHELALAASRSPAAVRNFGAVVSQEYRAIGVRMALSPSADLFTEPRWFNGQFTFGEDPTLVADLVQAYVEGLQGTAVGAASVAAVVGHFPGAGPAKGGWDARLEKGKLTSYSGTSFDTHLAPFERAFAAGVAGVMPGYAIPEQGAWTGLSGLVDGATIEQVGASFSPTLLTTVLRGHYGYGGLVLAPWGVLEDPGVSPLGAPWGVEGLTRAQRVAKAVNAGVDQFGGLDDPTAIAAARAAGDITDAQIDAAAARALALAFRLGLFENPYVQPEKAPEQCNTGAAKTSGWNAMDAGTVLLVNANKPAGWLDGEGDGTQVGDKGNAGNGTLKVLPAPPGAPYISAGCDYYVGGNFDLAYVETVKTGYGNLTNEAIALKGCPVATAAERMALSDYVFIRIDAPFTADPDGGPLGLPLASLEYAANDDAAALEAIQSARTAIDTYAGCGAPSQAQIVVAVDGGRPSVVSEILSIGVSGLYVVWGSRDDVQPDKSLLDVAFGIVNGPGKLPVGLPLSDAAAAAQLPDVPGDGQHATFVEGFGLQTFMF